MRPDVRRLVRDPRLEGAPVLVRGNLHPDYSSAAIYNPLDLRAPAPIFAWDRNAETRATVLRAYRDRPVWVLDGPTLTHDGYRPVRGPEHAASRFR